MSCSRGYQPKTPKGKGYGTRKDLIWTGKKITKIVRTKRFRKNHFPRQTRAYAS